jgi:hypothetical protein
MVLRKGFTRDEDGWITVAIEDIWRRVRRWAKRNGHVYQGSYGVVGVAPT